MEPEVTTAENEARSSIEVTRGVKGEYGWKIKVYLRNEELDDGPSQVQMLDLKMRSKFGSGS